MKKVIIDVDNLDKNEEEDIEPEIVYEPNKIGLDLDGVVFDSETTFRTYEELFDIEKNQNKLVDKSEPKYQKRYSWNEIEMKEFQK